MGGFLTTELRNVIYPGESCSLELIRALQQVSMLFNSLVEDRNGLEYSSQKRTEATLMQNSLEIEIPIETPLVAIRYYFLLFIVDFKRSSHC